MDADQEVVADPRGHAARGPPLPLLAAPRLGELLTGGQTHDVIGAPLASRLEPPDDAARLSTTYAGNFERLVALKTKVDPNNLFRLNANVAPKARA